MNFPKLVNNIPTSTIVIAGHTTYQKENYQRELKQLKLTDINKLRNMYGYMSRKTGGCYWRIYKLYFEEGQFKFKNHKHYLRLT